MAGRLFSALDTIEIRADQKPAIDAIEADLEKTRDVGKEPRQKLVTDIADGVVAGKIDKAKTDADLRALSTAVASATPSVQDAINRLYKTLDAAQRKKLVEALRSGHGMHGMGPGMHGGPPPGGGMGP
ncbi:MAG TPA: Spy/CpxP family protein refolding chaperone, partial [Polyangiaceae bacterium]|nr:Spy/CpxP family protein refolding chaperone [Polyangiaceae bacterium]